MTGHTDGNKQAFEATDYLAKDTKLSRKHTKDSNRNKQYISICSVAIQLICYRDIMTFPRNCNSKSHQR